MKTLTQIATLIILFAPLTSAMTQMPDSEVAVTVYNDNFGVVKETRNMDFTQKGVQQVKFIDVASSIDPTSVKFQCLDTDAGISILEQNYEYDLVNTNQLLKRYLNNPITIYIKGSGSDPGKTIEGILTAYVGSDLIVRNGPQIEIIRQNSIEHISLSKAPRDLITQPTLVWLAQVNKPGSKRCKVTYTTDNIKWHADYSAVLSPDDTSLDLSGWVTIENNSGKAYKNAAIKLIAGDVRRVKPQPQYRYDARELKMAGAAPSRGFEEKSFAEYHMYTLSRKSTINNNQVKQIEFIPPAEGVSVEKKYIYQWQNQPEKVQVKVEFKNTEQNNLGIALPKGKVRVFKQDQADGTLEFIGEDTIDHTPKKELLSLYIGNAFDIVPEHKTLDTQPGPRRGEYRTRTEKHQIELRNRKDTEVTVLAEHKFSPWVNWTVDDFNFPWEKENAATARFKVTIPPNSEKTLQYTVTWKW